MTMGNILILSLSITLQCIAVAIPLSLIKVTGKRLAWITIAIAITLMLIRRSISFVTLFYDDTPHETEIYTELVALLISALMVIGLAGIRPLFLSIQKSHKELLKRDIRLHKAQKIAQMGFWEWDILKNELYWSDELFLLFGFAPNSFKPTYQHFMNIVHPEDKVFVQQKLIPAIDIDTHYNFDFRVILTNGEEYFFHAQGDIDHSESQKPIRMLGTITNITARKNTEAQLKANENMFRSLLKSAPNGIVIVDEKGKIILVNTNIENLFGYKHESLIGKPVELLIPQRLRKGHVNKRKEFHKKNEARLMGEGTELYAANCKGEEFPVEISLSPVLIKNKIMTISIIRDLSIQKKMQKEKDKLQQQLFHSQKLETIGTLAGGIAHDFNNIITPILGYSEMILEEAEENTLISKDIKHVLKAANRAKDLVQQILIFSRQDEPEKAPLGISDIIKEAIDLLIAMLPKSIEIQVQINTKTDTVLANSTQIQQVIMNLCINASHAMKKNGGLLYLNLDQVLLDREFLLQHPKLNKKYYICLTVNDSGTGMDSQTLEHIFDPFFTTKSVGRGTGLGLSVVKGIVANHEGEITVRSTI